MKNIYIKISNDTDKDVSFKRHDGYIIKVGKGESTTSCCTRKYLPKYRILVRLGLTVDEFNTMDDLVKACEKKVTTVEPVVELKVEPKVVEEIKAEPKVISERVNEIVKEKAEKKVTILDKYTDVELKKIISSLNLTTNLRAKQKLIDFVMERASINAIEEVLKTIK